MRPVFRDKFSAYLVLALFSHWLAEPQADWPSHTSQPGFVYFANSPEDASLSSKLSDFLASEPNPLSSRKDQRRFTAQEISTK
jgi:hypothetical protein